MYLKKKQKHFNVCVWLGNQMKVSCPSVKVPSSLLRGCMAWHKEQGSWSSCSRHSHAQVPACSTHQQNDNRILMKSYLFFFSAFDPFSPHVTENVAILREIQNYQSDFFFQLYSFNFHLWRNFRLNLIFAEVRCFFVFVFLFLNIYIFKLIPPLKVVKVL